MQESNLPAPADSMVGKLLVASSLVDDPVLHRAVCLVVHQDPENVFAVLLNRPMAPHPELKKLLDDPKPNGGRLTDSDDAPKNSNLPIPSKPSPPAIGPSEAIGAIHFGGPLSGPVVAVHDNHELAEAVAGKGVYVAAQRDALENIIREKSGSYRLIVGHLGWSHKQLADERKSGFWHVLDATDDDVFTSDQEIWSSVIRRATSRSVATWLGIADTPFSSEIN
ncbi:MAG: YqgE/AlgH family protein [Planctomycetota bacterium]